MCIYKVVTFVKAQLSLHASSVLNVLLLCITAWCIKILSIILCIFRTSFFPVFNVVLECLQTFFTERDIFIASYQTCIKINQDKNAKNDFFGSKNRSFYLFTYQDQHLYSKVQSCWISIHFHNIDSYWEAYELLCAHFIKEP